MISLAFVFPAVAWAALVSACWFLIRSSDAYQQRELSKARCARESAERHAEETQTALNTIAELVGVGLVEGSAHKAEHAIERIRSLVTERSASFQQKQALAEAQLTIAKVRKLLVDHTANSKRWFAAFEFGGLLGDVAKELDVDPKKIPAAPPDKK